MTIACKVMSSWIFLMQNLFLEYVNSLKVFKIVPYKEGFTILNSLPSSNQIKIMFLGRWENQGTWKTSWSRVENQQTQSTYDTESGNQTQDTLLKGKGSHHCANPVYLVPQRICKQPPSWSSSCSS